MRLKKVRSGLFAAAVSVLALGSVSVFGPSAEATAFGSQAFGSFKVNVKGQTITIPRGLLTHDLRGSGKKVTSDRVAFEQVLGGPTCIYKYSFQYRNTSNKTYRTNTTGTVNKCTWGTAYYGFNYPGTLKYYGKACVVGYQGGKARATQCHYITA